MAITKSFKLAELIRHIEYDSTNDIISTNKGFKDKNKKKDATTKTATTQFALDTFAKADFRAARYIVAMSKGTNFHSTEIMMVHDGTSVDITQYGTLSDATLATFDADISGGNLRLRATPTSADSTVFKLSKTTIKV